MTAISPSMREPASGRSSATTAAACPAATPTACAADRAEAARLLAVLAAQQVPAAEPDGWFGLVPPTDEGPLFGSDDDVTLSPSQIEGYLRCARRSRDITCGGLV